MDVDISHARSFGRLLRSNNKQEFGRAGQCHFLHACLLDPCARTSALLSKYLVPDQGATDNMVFNVYAIFAPIE